VTEQDGGAGTPEPAGAEDGSRARTPDAREEAELAGEVAEIGVGRERVYPGGTEGAARRRTARRGPAPAFALARDARGAPEGSPVIRSSSSTSRPRSSGEPAVPGRTAAG
jgi:hypothetical protein